MPSVQTSNGTRKDIPHRATVTLDLQPSRKFNLPKTKSYAPQYAHIYFCRLNQLRPVVRKAAEAAFGSATSNLRYAKTLAEAPCDAPDTDTVLIGVVFRQMATKPSILAMYDQPSPHRLIPEPPARARAPYPAAGDTVFLEDDNARCTLDLSTLAAPPPDVVTGVVLAVRGREHRPTGAFRVSALALATPAPQPPRPSITGPSRRVCLLSGLPPSPASPAHALLLDTLQGGPELENAGFAASVALTVVAGNILPDAPPPPPAHEALPVHDAVREAEMLAAADNILSKLLAFMPVVLVPGVNDPANYQLPQQPLHRCLLPAATRSESFKRVTNPTEFDVDGLRFLVTAGQNVDDLSLYVVEGAEGAEEGKENGKVNGKVDKNGGSAGDGDGTTNENTTIPYRASGERVLDVMEMMVRNRHMAPTCPDTLASFPFSKSDPFVMNTTPHVFVVGNQKEFATRLMTLPATTVEESGDSMEVEVGQGTRTVRLISLSRMDESGQAVFLDLNTLQCDVHDFAVSL